MRDQSSQWVRWSTMCCRTSQSKISAPPPVSDSRPASISSSRISEARQPGDGLEVVDLGGRERLQGDLRQRLLERLQRTRVVPPRQGRVQAVDDVQLGEVLALHRLGEPDGLLDAHRVRVLLARLALERAVGARRGAHVGHVEVAVDVEVDDVAVLARAHLVGEPAEPGQVVGLVEGDAVLAGQPLTGADLLLQLALEPGVHACAASCSDDLQPYAHRRSGRPPPYRLTPLRAAPRPGSPTWWRARPWYGSGTRPWCRRAGGWSAPGRPRRRPAP